MGFPAREPAQLATIHQASTRRATEHAGAALFPLAITLLFYEFPPQQRSLATGILRISALLAPAVGPTLGGYFVTYANWPLIFYIKVRVGIIAIIMGIVLLRKRPA